MYVVPRVLDSRKTYFNLPGQTQPLNLHAFIDIAV